MENGLFSVDDKRMTSIVATLISNDQRSFISKQINDLTFTFVAPLRAENYDVFTHYVCYQRYC